MNKEIGKKASDLALLKLLRSDPVAAEKGFNKLSLGDQASLFLRAEDRDRLRLVEIARAPRQLLEKIPATEIWFTIKRLTPADSLSLIKYSTPEQLQVISDIEWWRKDCLDSAAIYQWLAYISACGMEKMMEWFREGDWDQIEWFFKENVVVFKKEEKDQDPFEAISWPRKDAPMTFEGLYYFQVLNRDRDQLVRRFLEVLAKHDLNAYHKICEACIWEIPSLREEEAYEVKSRRLAEHGFPSFDEAIAIYAPLDKKKIGLAKKRAGDRGVEQVPRYPLVVMGDRILFINRVISESGPEGEDRFLLESAGIANKVLIADGKEITAENLTAALVKTIGYVNIGLEALSGGDVAKAKALMDEYWLSTIFQVGLSEVVKLSGDVQKIFKKSWMKGNRDSLELLEPDLRLIVENLLSKRPRYFTGEDELALDSVRDFASGGELSLAKWAALEAEFVGRLMERHFVKSAVGVFGLVDRPEDRRFTGIFLTTLANGLLGGSWEFGPVKRDAFKKFLKQLHLSEGEIVLEEKLREFKSWILSEDEGLTREEQGYLEDFIQVSKERLLDEFRSVAAPPEPKFIHSVWVV